MDQDIQPLTRIGQMCDEFGVTPRTLRFYESRGLLAPIRRGQLRLYSRRDRGRLTLILRGKRFGFSLDDIAALLALYDPQRGNLAQSEATLAAARARLAELRAQAEELQATIVELDERIRNGEAALDRRRASLPRAAVPDAGPAPAEVPANGPRHDSADTAPAVPRRAATH